MPGSKHSQRWDDNILACHEVHAHAWHTSFSYVASTYQYMFINKDGFLLHLHTFLSRSFFVASYANHVKQVERNWYEFITSTCALYIRAYVFMATHLHFIYVPLVAERFHSRHGCIQGEFFPCYVEWVWPKVSPAMQRWTICLANGHPMPLWQVKGTSRYSRYLVLASVLSPHCDSLGS